MLSCHLTLGWTQGACLLPASLGIDRHLSHFSGYCYRTENHIISEPRIIRIRTDTLELPARMLAIAIVVGLLAQSVVASSRCYYDQSCFPSTTDLTVFNSTVGGRLVAIRPLQSVCYVGSDLNLGACVDVNINYSNDTYRYVAM